MIFTQRLKKVIYYFFLKLGYTNDDFIAYMKTFDVNDYCKDIMENE